MRRLLLAAALALQALAVAAPATAQDSYRALTAQAAPGELLELIELYREEKALLRSIGEPPALWMRHSQGDFWDLLLLYPIESASAWLSEEAAARRAGARTPSGRSGAELQREIDARTAWREEVFVRGPAFAEVEAAFADAGFFHVEIFQGLAGKRAELVREREMENDYLVRLGRAPNHIFTRIAGSATDAFTIGYYRDLQHYANPPASTVAEREAAARAAGFEGADFIGSYLRELLLRHHDTLAVAIP